MELRHVFDNLTYVASKFRLIVQPIIDVNENKIQIFDTIFILVSKFFNLTQLNNIISAPTSSFHENNDDNEYEMVGLGICPIFLLILVGRFWCYKKTLFKKKEK